MGRSTLGPQRRTWPRVVQWNLTADGIAVIKADDNEARRLNADWSQVQVVRRMSVSGSSLEVRGCLLADGHDLDAHAHADQLLGPRLRLWHHPFYVKMYIDNSKS